MANRDYTKIPEDKKAQEKKTANPYKQPVKKQSANPYVPSETNSPENQNERQKTWVKVSSQFLNLRAEPTKDSRVKIILSKGQELRVVSDNDGWKGVVYSDKDGEISGYVMSEYTESSYGQ